MSSGSPGAWSENSLIVGKHEPTRVPSSQSLKDNSGTLLENYEIGDAHVGSWKENVLEVDGWSGPGVPAILGHAF